MSFSLSAYQIGIALAKSFRKYLVYVLGFQPYDQHRIQHMLKLRTFNRVVPVPELPERAVLPACRGFDEWTLMR